MRLVKKMFYKEKTNTGVWNSKKILLITLCCFAAGLFIFWKTDISNDYVLYEQVIESEVNGEFIAKDNDFSKISLCIDDGQLSSKLTQGAVVSIRILDAKGNMVWQGNTKSENIPSDGFGDVKIRGLMNATDLSQNQIRLVKGQHYIIKASMDGMELSKISFALLGHKTNLKLLYFILCIIVMLMVLCGGFLFSCDSRRKFILAFAGMCLVSGIGSNFVMKPICTPDEYTHFGKAYSISNRILYPEIQLSSPEVTFFTESGVRRVGYRADEMQDVYHFWTDWEYGNQSEQVVSWKFSLMPNVPSYSYIPAAIGVLVARFVHAPYQIILLSGRLCNLLFVIMLAIIAMLIEWEYHYAIAAIFLLPSTIWLSASYSYDGWNLGFCVIFVVLCLKYARSSNKMRFQDVMLLLMVLLLFVPIKLIYVIIALSLLFIPLRQWNKKSTIVGSTVSIVTLLGIMFITRGKEAIALVTTPLMDTRGNSDNAGSYTIDWVINHPKQTFMVYLNTLHQYLGYYIRKSIIGESYYDYVPKLLSIIMLMIFMLIMISYGSKVTKYNRIIAWVIFGIGSISVLTTFLFVYSTIPVEGIALIAGAQGRYFLPYFIMLPLMVHSDKATKVLKNRYQYMLLFLLNVLSAVILVAKFGGIAAQI